MGIVAINGIPVYQALVDSAETGMLRISLVDNPAVDSDFMAFEKAGEPVRQMFAVQDEEKRLILGCVMRADYPILRSRDGQLFYMVYNAETIRVMAEKYLAENRQNLVNLGHVAGTEQEGVRMVQYFIKGNGLNPEGFEDIADGSLFAEFHVLNDEVWAAVKAGTYKGFSLEGIFDLAPERDRATVEEIVEALDGVFSRILQNQTYNKMKKKGILARLAAMLVEMGNVSTDRGVLAWDGDADLKAGDAVFIEDENGERRPAAEGDYRTGDNKVIVVVDGKVAEIRDAEAEVAPAEAEAVPEAEAEAEAPAQNFASRATDKGEIFWNGEEDLKAGDEVFINDAEGNRVAAPDGEYVTDDAKTIVVADGRVAEIRDPEAEVAPVEDEAFTALKAENEALKVQVEYLTAQVAQLNAQVEEMSKTPAAKPAHEEFTGSVMPEGKTGNKGLDRLARYMATK